MNIVCDNSRFGFVAPACSGDVPTNTMDINYNQCTLQYFVCEKCMKVMSADAVKFGHTGTVRNGVDMVSYIARERENGS